MFHRQIRPAAAFVFRASARFSVRCDGHQKRSVLFGRYTVPTLGFDARMQWLAKVQRLVAQCTASHEQFPHKVIAVANVLAHIGNECRLCFEGIAERAGCVPRTAQTCVNWLEERGVLTWVSARTLR